MLFLLLFLLTFIILDVAALRWGFNSTEGFNSCEWSRREHWGEKTGEQAL